MVQEESSRREAEAYFSAYVRGRGSRGGRAREGLRGGFAKGGFVLQKFSKNEKSSRKGSSGHGFGSRPLNWLSFFAENPFPATPGPGEAEQITKIAQTISQHI